MIKIINSSFFFFFLSIGASFVEIHTFIRHVISIDGTHFKAKYLGTLFIVPCKDDNNQIYPLVFGISDSKNDVKVQYDIAT